MVMMKFKPFLINLIKNMKYSKKNEISTPSYLYSYFIFQIRKNKKLTTISIMTNLFFVLFGSSSYCLLCKNNLTASVRFILFYFYSLFYFKRKKIAFMLSYKDRRKKKNPNMLLIFQSVLFYNKTK
jgi:hypothetical protein